MRILQVNTESTWRGGERQTLYTAIGLLDKGVDVELMVLSGSMLHRRAKKSGIKVIPVGGVMELIKKIASLRGRYSCIHAQSAKAHTQMVITKILHRMPVIYTRRVDFVPSGWMTRIKYKYTDKVVSISHKISEILEESGMWRKSTVISSAINGKSLNKERARKVVGDFDLSPDSKVIGIIAALEPHKDPWSALDVAEALRKKRQDFSVLHFGGGELVAEIGAELAGRGMSDYYRLMGHMDDVEDFFSLFDVFLMTSREEGLGSSVLDAFYYEVPVVSTGAGGLRETVQGRGTLCDIGNTECLAESIDQVLTRSESVNHWVAQARDYVDENCTVDLMVEKYLSLYGQV